MVEDNVERVKALVLIRTDPMAEKNMLKKLLSFEGVTEAHFIYGPYDEYCIIDCPSYDALNELVMNKIRGLEGIKSTTTCYLAD